MHETILGSQRVSEQCAKCAVLQACPQAAALQVPLCQIGGPEPAEYLTSREAALQACMGEECCR